MKIAISVATVMLLLLVTSSLTLAAQPTPPTKSQGQGQSQNENRGQSQKGGPSGTPGTASLAKRHGLAGTVQNKGANGFDVVAKKGTEHVVANASTKYLVKGKSQATLDDISNGNRVNAHGTQESNGLLAKWVHVIPGAPSIGHVVGQVVSFTPAGASNGSITVQDRSGTNRVLVVTSKTKINLQEGSSSIQVGDRVTVVGTKDMTPTARGIVVQGGKQ